MSRARLRQLLRTIARTRPGRALRRRLGGLRRPPGHSHSHAYTEEELLARAEEFNRNAERHWRSIAAEPAGRAHALNKPFSTVRDTPSILYRLGLVLDALDLGVGHTVLDFGAGSCWLASCLNRLRCRTVAVEVSRTALELGEELFRLDPRHRLDLLPRFLPYDGHRIPLPDRSLDRVACFDAFHHVPNQDEVLSELYRVLKPGGRVVLAEPGEGHAHMDQSVYETERCGVLENDLHLGELVEKARKAGFDRVLMKPYPDAGAITLTASEYLRLIEGEERVYPMHVLRDNLRHFYIVILTKGEPRRDSRNPRDLRARIALAGARSFRGEAGGRVRVPLTVENFGDTTWLHEIDEVGGYVMLGGHLLNETGQVLATGFLRTGLPRDVAPGEKVELDVEVPLPSELGRYLVRFDMVDEFVAWFGQCGSKTQDIEVVVDSFPDSRRPHHLRAAIEAEWAGLARPVKPGSPLSLTVRLTDTGDTVWLDAPEGTPGRVALGAHLLSARGEVVSWDFLRVGLPGSVRPKETVELACAFAAPPEPGRYRLRLDLVAEQVSWFESYGSQTVDLKLETTAETPDSLNPGLLGARLEVAEASRRLEARAGAPISFPLRVTNTGNTLWLPEAEPGRGYVALGGHLYDARRARLSLDLFRVRLPRAVGPGERVDLVCAFKAPEPPGRYLVELDMVDEGIAWFASRGSPTLEIEVLSV